MILHNILPIISLYKQRILMPIRLLLRFVKIVWPNTHFPIRAAYRHAYIWSIIPLFIYHRTYIYICIGKIMSRRDIKFYMKTNTFVRRYILHVVNLM